MELKADFIRELNKAIGDGTPEGRSAFLSTAREAAQELSTPDAAEKFDEVLKKYGRAAVAVCVAATLDDHRSKMKPRTVRWAVEVLVGTWRVPPYLYQEVRIDGRFPPSKIEQRADNLINSTIASDSD